MNDLLKPGDIVQVTNDNLRWFPCLLIVDEVKSWGIQAYALIPANDGSGTKQAFTRLQHGEYEYVGTAAYARPHVDGEDGDA